MRLERLVLVRVDGRRVDPDQDDAPGRQLGGERRIQPREVAREALAIVERPRLHEEARCRRRLGEVLETDPPPRPDTRLDDLAGPDPGLERDGVDRGGAGHHVERRVGVRADVERRRDRGERRPVRVRRHVPRERHVSRPDGEARRERRREVDEARHRPRVTDARARRRRPPPSARRRARRRGPSGTASGRRGSRPPRRSRAAGSRRALSKPPSSPNEERSPAPYALRTPSSSTRPNSSVYQ